jgi:hypothetical protein
MVFGGMRKSAYVLFIVSILCAASSAYAKDIPFTQEDRDRLIRLEEGLKATNQRIADLKISTQQQFDRLYTLILWGFGILFGGMGILIGFVIWDRRTVVAPVARTLKEKEGELEELKKKEIDLEKRERVIEKILRGYAQKEPRPAELMNAKGF